MASTKEVEVLYLKKTIQRFLNSGYLFKTVFDGTAYLMLYCVVPIIDIWQGYHAISGNDPTTYSSWNWLLLIVAFNALYDCYGRCSPKQDVNNLKAYIVGIPNLLLLILAVMLNFSVLSPIDTTAVVMAYVYGVSIAVFVVYELGRIAYININAKSIIP